MNKLLIIISCTLFSPMILAEENATFRITVNGIFPESPVDKTVGNVLEEQFRREKLIVDNDAETTDNPQDAVESLDNSQLKANNAPTLRVDSSHAKRGKSYVVNGRRYVPFSHITEFSQEGVASWYGPGFHGRKTANGERFDQHAMTAAHKELPLNSLVKVTRVSTGESIIVRINDRGPFHGNRVIDLSYGAAKKLGIIKKGAAKVKIELLDKKTKAAK